jgi:hypothetical protein
MQQQATAAVAWERLSMMNAQRTAHSIAAPDAKRAIGIDTRRNAERYKLGNRFILRL